MQHDSSKRTLPIINHHLFAISDTLAGHGVTFTLPTRQSATPNPSSYSAMSKLLDLDLNQCTLALDLVATWQLEKVKEQPLWDAWSEMDDVQVPGDTNVERFNGLDFRDNLVAVKCNEKQYYLCGELDVRLDSFYLIGRALQFEEFITPTLHETSERREYRLLDCEAMDFACVSRKFAYLPSS